MSDYCLTTNKQLLGYVMARTSYIRWDHDDDDLFVLYQQFSWIFIVLAHCNNSLWVDMSLHSESLVLFRTNLSLLLLINVACLVQNQQIPIL
jgi:hypothetical protein